MAELQVMAKQAWEPPERAPPPPPLLLPQETASPSSTLHGLLTSSQGLRLGFSWPWPRHEATLEPALPPSGFCPFKADT